MAEEKEEDGGGWGISTELEIFLAIVVVIVLVIISGVLKPYMGSIDSFIDFFTSKGNQTEALNSVKTVIGSLVGLSIPVSVMLLIGIVVSVERLKKIRKKEHTIFNPHSETDEAHGTTVENIPGLSAVPVTASAAVAVPRPDQQNITRWRKILVLVDSQNQNDWRQAIIEADIILDEILTAAHYPGDSIGEKLTGSTKADFQTLDLAWEAHKVRNNIAHEGSSFVISQHEAKRVINLFKQVFEEFLYI